MVRVVDGLACGAMRRRPTPSPTPYLDQALPRYAPVARTFGVETRIQRTRSLATAWIVVAAGIAVAAAGHALVRIRRLREQGAKVRPLQHDVGLPGRFPPRRLVVLGDSAAAGHGLPDAEAALARRVGRGLAAIDGRQTTVSSVAVDGATTAEVLEAQVEATTDAHVVLIGVGVNDAIRPGRSIAPAASALGAVLRATRRRAADDAAILVLSCPDLSLAPGLPWLLRPVVGRRCRALAVAQERVATDLGVAVVRADRSVLSPELFGPDGFHPGPLGHERLSGEVLRRLGIDRSR
jgi:lysophospholipase L1-like esterase